MAEDLDYVPLPQEVVALKEELGRRNQGRGWQAARELNLGRGGALAPFFPPSAPYHSRPLFLRK
jgi:hypothetical protein